MRHGYDAPGWGAGEVWVRGRMVLVHVLAGSDPAAVGDEVGAHAEPGVGTVSRPVGSASRGALDPRRAGGREPRPASLGPAPPRGDTRPPDSTLSGDLRRVDHAFVTDLCRRFAAHLRGEPVAYDDVELDLDGRTDFERDLTRAIRRVPWGEVVSYGELAALAGRPGAARAAGTFCAGSDVALVIPCHRVIAADGIGGYGSSGAHLKRRLLALEGVRL